MTQNPLARIDPQVVIQKEIQRSAHSPHNVCRSAIWMQHNVYKVDSPKGRAVRHFDKLGQVLPGNDVAHAVLVHLKKADDIANSQAQPPHDHIYVVGHSEISE